MPQPNHFTYHTGELIPGTIQKGRLAVAVIDRDYGGSTSSTPGNKVWVNGRQNNGNFIIYSDTYTFGRTNEESATTLIKISESNSLSDALNLINQLPNRPKQFDDFLTAYEWLQSQPIYLIQNKPILPFVTDSLKVAYDASLFASYPQVGNKIWSFSGETSYSSLQSMTFSTLYGGIIRSNGSSDQFMISQNLKGKFDLDFSIFIWLRVNSSGVILSEQDSIYSNNQFRYSLINFNQSNKFVFSLYSNMGLQGFEDSTPRTINHWYQVGITYDRSLGKFCGYVNGQLVNEISNIIKEDSDSGNLYYSIGSACDTSISSGVVNSGKFDFSLIQIHDAVLPEDKILENYLLTKSRFD